MKEGANVEELGPPLLDSLRWCRVLPLVDGAAKFAATAAIELFRLCDGGGGGVVTLERGEGEENTADFGLVAEPLGPVDGDPARVKGLRR